MDTKYTKDGKKVAVLSKLNNTEWIVQEIYVNDSGEFPAGENFVVQTLLDEPAHTFQERQIAEREKTLKILEKQIEDYKHKSRVAKRESEAGALINRILARYADVDVGELEPLIQFMTGQITHVVIDKSFGDIRIETLADALTSKNEWGFDGIKLVTLFGVRKDGSRWKCKRCEYALDWQLDYYTDGSGGSGREIIPFTSLDAAKAYVEGKIAAMDKVGDRELKAKEKYGLQYPSSEQIAALRATQRDAKAKSIETLKKALEIESEEFMKLGGNSE